MNPPLADHRSLARWAADCARRVLPLFEEACPRDDRPRKAVEAARAWARSDIGYAAVRAAALAAHAAAREIDQPAARAAARAAGHAAATGHAAAHSRAAGTYAIAAVSAAAAARERAWQVRHLPKRLRPIALPDETPGRKALQAHTGATRSSVPGTIRRRTSSRK